MKKFALLVVLVLSTMALVFVGCGVCPHSSNDDECDGLGPPDAARPDAGADGERG